MRVEYVLDTKELDKFANMLEEMGEQVIRTSATSFKVYDAKKNRLKKIVKVRTQEGA